MAARGETIVILLGIGLTVSTLFCHRNRVQLLLINSFFTDICSTVHFWQEANYAIRSEIAS